MGDAILNGEHLNTVRDADGKTLSDANLRAKLTAKHASVACVHGQTSDFIHLSERPLYNSIAHTGDGPKTVYFSIICIF